jgi:CubicO group peptidase (beta-lactamase class C family)
MTTHLHGAVVAEAQSLPVATPKQVGLSTERLNKITATLRGDVEKGIIPGAILLVGRPGKVALFDAVGVRDPATKAPMTKDSIFRIYSMSKPITSVAAMLLFEDGKFSLADPVSKYIPQLGGPQGGHREARSQWRQAHPRAGAGQARHDHPGSQNVRRSRDARTG